MEDEMIINNNVSSSLLLTAGGVATAVNSAVVLYENNSSSNWTWVLEEDYLKNSPAVQVHIYVLYAVIFVVGLLGNVLVVFVVAQNRAMQTVTNCFIANLALSDILLCVLAVPFTPLYFFLKEWIFGKILCHLVAYSQGTSVYVSTLTLTSIAIDRFFVILYPFRPRMKMTTCWITICAIWLVALCATLPYGIFVDIKTINNMTYCEESWTYDSDRQIYGAVTSVMQFVVPFIIMAFAYTKVSLKLADRSREKAKIRLRSCRGEELDRERKRRTNRMLIAMVTIFGASWMPLNLINLLNDLYAESMAWWKYYNLCFFLAHTVAMSSTCYNVFLYAWLNDNFRKELKRILPCFPGRGAGNSTGGGVAAGPGGTATQAAGLVPTAQTDDQKRSALNGEAARSNQVIQSAQILLPDEAEEELMNNEQQQQQLPVSSLMVSDSVNGSPGAAATLAAAATVMASSSVDGGRNHVGRVQHTSSQHLSTAIELTPLAFTTSDTCPQCSSAATKTSFMTFDELADVSSIIITNSNANNSNPANVANG